MFITIDGPDGVGKSSVAIKLTDLINSKGQEGAAIYTGEPTRGPVGQKIRELLKSEGGDLTISLTNYFIQDRAEHVKEIERWLEEDRVVVCDRYKYSTVVYQHLQKEDIGKLIKLNSGFLKPDLAVILNVDNADILDMHIAQRGNSRDLFEERHVLEEAIRLYGQMDQFFPDDNICYINADKSVDEVVSDIARKLAELNPSFVLE